MTAYLGIPVFALLSFSHRLIKGRSDAWCHLVGMTDLTTGLAESIAEESDGPKKSEEWWKKLDCFA